MNKDIANNPQTFMNTFHSAIRNSIIVCTLGIAMYGFSNNYKKGSGSHITMRLMSLSMYLLAFSICLITTRMFTDYYYKLEQIDKTKLPLYINTKYWKLYQGVGYFFCVILMMFILLASKMFILKILGYKP